jgi:UPF0716 family protein affecting phage T7 exclusion
MAELLGIGLLAALLVGAAVAGHWLLRRTGRNDDATRGDNPYSQGDSAGPYD